MQKKKEMLEASNAANAGSGKQEMAFPDITSKPGAVLPSIFGDGGAKGGFEIEKLDDKVLEDAEGLQKKLMEERQRKIAREKKEREEHLAKTAGVSEDAQREMVQKGLASMGLGDKKEPDMDEMEKRKKVMAGLKEIIKEE